MADTHEKLRDPLQGRTFGGAGIDLLRSLQSKTKRRMTRRIQVLGLLVPLAFGAGWFNGYSGKGGRNLTFEEAMEIIDHQEQHWARQTGVGRLRIHIERGIEVLGDVGSGDDTAAQHSYLHLYWVVQRAAQQFMRLSKDKPEVYEKYNGDNLYRKILETLEAQPRAR